MSFGWGQWPPYVRVADRRRHAQQEAAKLRKKGVAIAPVVVEGRKITRTFWGMAWCTNLESYSDFESRLPRGRSYVRNGLVIHLEIASGKVTAFVRGTSTYEVAVNISPVPKQRWRSICKESAGAIDSLVELLQGRFSKAVMDRICRQNSGLFPSPREIEFSCSCPDFASMCKHVAAVLYGVGVRLDEQPELLFRLRDVSEHDLIASADAGMPLSKRRPSKARVLEGADLSQLFGLQLGGSEVDESGRTTSEDPRRRRRRSRAAPARKKAPAVTSAARKTKKPRRV
jgi:uncharacterized Zn finger protein